MKIGVFFCKCKFFPLSASNTELVNASVSQHVMASADDTGMTQFCTEIILSQIGMRVKMDDVHFRKTLVYCTYICQRYKMFSAQKQWHFSLFHNLIGMLFNVGKCILCIAKAQLQISAVKYKTIRQIFILIRTVCFQPEAFMAHR